MLSPMWNLITPNLRQCKFKPPYYKRSPHRQQLDGRPSIAVGLGDYVGGRLRVDGARRPRHIRDHAVVYDGRTKCQWSEAMCQGDFSNLKQNPVCEFPDLPKLDGDYAQVAVALNNK